MEELWGLQVTENPYESPVNVASSNEVSSSSVTHARATYNVISDTVTGVNVRWSDNRFQAIFVAISVIVTALLGALLAALNTSWNLPWYGGGLIGSFAGLVIGILGSGIVLMFYRAAQHFQGKHD